MIHENIWQDPKTGEPLHYSKNGRLLVNDGNKAKYQINENGIAEFIESSDIKGSNEKSTAFYNSFSPFYELGQKFYYSFFGGEISAREDYLKYLDINDGDRVLEVSVGTAANIKFLPREANCYGIDISKGQLVQALKNKRLFGLPLNLCLSNAEALPFRDNSFDCVYHIGGINLFSDKKKAISEMVRVAKPGTKIMISDETEKVAEKYEKLPYFGKPFRNRGETIKAPVDLLPENVENVETFEIRKGTLYVLCFKKI
jgi:ubiquinone/menaquinone biosynthesis C-methylase UbiE